MALDPIDQCAESIWALCRGYGWTLSSEVAIHGIARRLRGMIEARDRKLSGLETDNRRLRTELNNVKEALTDTRAKLKHAQARVNRSRVTTTAGDPPCQK